MKRPRKRKRPLGASLDLHYQIPLEALRIFRKRAHLRGVPWKEALRDSISLFVVRMTESWKKEVER